MAYQQVDLLEVRAWGETVGAVALDPATNYYAFEYADEWVARRVELAPLHMPNRPGPYIFPELPVQTFLRLPAMLADSLPDRFGNALVTAQLAEAYTLATYSTASRLARAWREHRVEKTYRALGLGAARTESLVIDSPIGPVPHPILGTVQAACEGGKPSRSAAIVLERRGDRTLFQVEIATGRPHQIRIHMACAGHPLVGDPLYVAGGGLKQHPGLPGDGGYWLHAQQLRFEHPRTGQPMTMAAPPPPELRMREEGAVAGSEDCQLAGPRR